jgi:hypothetical protein
VKSVSAFPVASSFFVFRRQLEKKVVTGHVIRPSEISTAAQTNSRVKKTWCIFDIKRNNGRNETARLISVRPALTIPPSSANFLFTFPFQAANRDKSAR